MTVQQVADMPPVTVTRSDGSTLTSTASGRYQFLGKTLRALISSGAVSGDQQFDERTQDLLANRLIESRGLKQYQSGKISQSDFLDNLSKEWASLPTAGGSGYYSGQRASHAPDEVYAALPAQAGRQENIASDSNQSDIQAPGYLLKVADTTTPEAFQQYLREVERNPNTRTSWWPQSEESLIEMSRTMRRALNPGTDPLATGEAFQGL
jgi:muramidase (phage lysozyme)